MFTLKDRASALWRMAAHTCMPTYTDIRWWIIKSSWGKHSSKKFGVVRFSFQLK